MDIWAWVERTRAQLRADGHRRLADLIEQLPDAVCEDEHARVDAMYPEALALARASGNPWLEVFVRHWNLQSRILHRYEVADWMGEAVALLEYASRPDTRDCPQSTCVTQDLVNCYGNTDGPGFAQERIDASRQTLSRIDPSWPCYECIGAELLSALLDGGRAEEALATLDEMESELTIAHRWRGPDPMGMSRVEILRVLGRLDEALVVLDRLEEEDDDDLQAWVERQLERTWLLADAGRPDEALKARVDWEQVRGTRSNYDAWVNGELALVRAGAVANDWPLEARLQGINAELVSHGVLRQAFDLAIERGRLAVDRDRPWTAERCLELARELAPRLRAPLGAPLALERLEKAVAGMVRPSTDPPTGPDAVLAAGDPEVDLPRLDAAVARWPDAVELQVERARAWHVLGLTARAEAALTELGDDAGPAGRLLLARLLIERGGFEEAGRIGRALTDHAAGAADGDLAREASDIVLAVATHTGDRDQMQAMLEAKVAADPTAPEPVLALADALDAAGRRTDALDLLDQLLAGEVPPGPWDDRRMVLATALGRWDAVRASARRRGLAVPAGDGPIDESGDLIRVRFDGDDRPSTLIARRTGPATALIVGFEGPGSPCHLHDDVLIEPTPGRVDDQGLGTHRCVEVVDAGGYAVVALDAVWPGEQALEGVFAALDAMDCHTRRASGSAYELIDPDSGETRPAVYCHLAVPRDRLRAVELTLRMICATWPGPAVWLELLDALGERTRHAAQRAIADAWGM